MRGVIKMKKEGATFIGPVFLNIQSGLWHALQLAFACA